MDLTRSRPFRRQDRRGMALIMALLVMTILIMVVLQMSLTSSQNKSIAQNYQFDLQNTYAAQSGYPIALLYLKTDAELAPDVDSLNELWAKSITKTIGSSELTITIEDAERKINLAQLVKNDGKVNPAVEQQLKNLVAILGHPEELSGRIVDYIDPDGSGSYEDGARNMLPINIEELLRIKDFKPEYLLGGKVEDVERKGVSAFVTLWPQPSQAPPQQGEGQQQQQGFSGGRHLININTAPVEVLLALSTSVTQDLANAIISTRTSQGTDGKTKEFKSADELKSVPGMTEEIYNQIKDGVTVRSKTFLIRSMARSGGLEKGWVYIVSRDKSGLCKLISSQRVFTLSTLAPPKKESDQ